MKTIEEKAKEYAAKCHCQNTEWGFIAGAQSEHEELTRWHDPKEELPDDGQEVLCVTKRRCNTFSVLQHDNYGWWQYIPFEGGGWCEYDGEVIGWREIM
ncbi:MULTISPECIES: hypothetical protein [Bacteroidales]|uniref:hypothetical protein n=1 Tax=Bacteroidales TaxID=171549 RepID=UPI0025B68BD3|nr:MULTISPECIES: hypothetical protein [Bacteroidales]